MCKTFSYSDISGGGRKAGYRHNVRLQTQILAQASRLQLRVVVDYLARLYPVGQRVRYRELNRG